MEPTFPLAIDHIRIMEARIRQQEATIERLAREGLETSSAVRRLKLLLSTLEDMRLPLAQLAPTQEPMVRPAWTLPLAMLGNLRN